MSAAAVLDLASNNDQLHAPFKATHPRARHQARNRSAHTTVTNASAKPRHSSKQLQQLYSLYNETKDLFYESALANSFEALLSAKNRPQITKAISLGLGSLGATKDQPRRIKQLVIFMAIASKLSSTANGPVSLYAQDPTFNKTDEEFLLSLGVQVLKTPASSDLGEAGHMIDEQTLVYSPFLTIEAYTQLFSAISNQPERSASSRAIVPVLIGDDFNALKMKWEKRTAEHRDVDNLIKTMKSRAYQRRAISGEGFWRETDSPFPMALYWRQAFSGERNRRKGAQDNMPISRL